MLLIAGRALISDLGTRCSLGAVATDALGRLHVVTAGHAKGSSWWWQNGPLGPTHARFFDPLDCRSLLVEDTEAEPTNLVDRFDGRLVRVTGIAEPYVGMRVARSGAKTRWQTGTVTHLQQDQHFDLGRCVRNLIRTDVPSWRGDSGGPLLTDPGDGVTAQLVGFTSGGWDRRTRADHERVTLFQPVAPALEALGLTLYRQEAS